MTRSGAPVVVAFQSGDGQRVDRTSAYGHPVPLTHYRHRVEDVVDALVEAGFAIHATVRREPSQAHETTPQAFLLATHLAGLRMIVGRGRLLYGTATDDGLPGSCGGGATARHGRRPLREARPTSPH